MAKGKKASGVHYTSKGERKADRDTTKAMRRDRNPLDSMLNKVNAWKAGKKVYLTVPNPEPSTMRNKPYVRVNARDVWGDPKRGFAMKSHSSDDKETA